MHDDTRESLRSKDPTREGRHLHEPDGFPHTMIAVLAFFVVLFPICVGAAYVATGIGGALVVAGILLFFGFPIVTAKLNRRVEHARVDEQHAEHEVEAAEAAGLPHPRTANEHINDQLNRTYEQRARHLHN